MPFWRIKSEGFHQWIAWYWTRWRWDCRSIDGTWTTCNCIECCLDAILSWRSFTSTFLFVRSFRFRNVYHDYRLDRDRRSHDRQFYKRIKITVYFWLGLVLKKKPTGVTGIQDHSGKSKIHGGLIGAKEWFFQYYSRRFILDFVREKVENPKKMVTTVFTEVKVFVVLINMLPPVSLSHQKRPLPRPLLQLLPKPQPLPNLQPKQLQQPQPILQPNLRLKSQAQNPKKITSSMKWPTKKLLPLLKNFKNLTLTKIMTSSKYSFYFPFLHL